jgi:two-component system OmpR family response regulator
LGEPVRVLVVEDDDRLLNVVMRFLGNEGHSVQSTSDGDEAAWMLSEFRYDVVVLDWMVPGRSGVSLCRELRAREDWTPVLLLTARDAVQDRVEGLESGADDYLVKPFSLAELAARLHALARRGHAPRPSQLTAGDIVLDPRTREVSVGSAVLALTPREFALLEFLLRRKGEVLSRAELIQNVWDHAYDGGSNVVDVYVGYLRRKLGREGDRLEPIRGVGYRLRG